MTRDRAWTQKEGMPDFHPVVIRRKQRESEVFNAVGITREEAKEQAARRADYLRRQEEK